ncbi:aminotransferase class IV [Candidatus Arcticimaribacter forsetii]|uniref:aminotransferase class IV n=1 Tax=Candidatus Arcticimaribacter forsetii TaxID=2820661 RepID=UPI00207751B2|nr:aminotransferase class IV [Candidatus Arcticimaribacter forsetii]MDB2330059.1 aminotransferase class IV [Flavobacteriaceae bacterium]MDB4675112.1 aminotransferase class IV [Flavobacteriaceae bacterium]
MYPLFESIRVEGGNVHLLQYHQKRLERSYLYMFKKKCAWQLNSMIPELPKERSYKLRFLYNKDRFTFELLPYTSRKIECLKLIEIDSYSYDHKFTDRSGLDNAYKLRGDCDDVLLTKNGFLTDTSYCNILLFDGTKWVTPEKPLFEGVQREFLIDQQRVIPMQIHVNDLSDFISFQLVNALNPFEENQFEAVGGIV